MSNFNVKSYTKVFAFTSFCALMLSMSPSAFARSTQGYAPLRKPAKPLNASLSPNAAAGHVVVKFREGMTVHSGKSRLGAASARRVIDVFTQRGLPQPAPSITGDAESIRQKRMAAEDRAKTLLPDLSLYFRLELFDPALATDLINELNTLDEVEVAFYAPLPEVASRPRSLSERYDSWGMASSTPNFESGQLYLKAAPGGINAYAAWTLPGGTGSGTQIIDIEYGWQLTHEDLPGGASAIVIGTNVLGDTDHGTAVLGEMAAGRNGFGMTGIAYDTDIGISSVASMSTANAITLAANASSPGDAILIELHAPGPHYNFQGREDQAGYVAMEYFQDNFDAILNAWAQGVIVCEAAGNGGEDFDDPMYDSLFHPDYRFSHAIICGAGNPPNSLDPDRSKLNFSNWGQRVDLQGYGIMVYTMGYGDLHNAGGRDFWYTAGFSGTSSASPIVTGAVLCVSGVFQQLFGIVPDADTISNLLKNTGSPQQAPNLWRNIGPRPDLRAALGGLFEPVDSIWYGNITIASGESAAIPITLSNSHPVRDIYLPFLLNGPAPIVLDSVTRGPRTENFEQVLKVFDHTAAGKVGYLLRADNGNGTPYLPAGNGIVGYLWVHANSGPGNQIDILDSAWLGSSTRLRLISAFDDGYPDYFQAGSITTVIPCDCSAHGDVSDDGAFDVTDIIGVVNIAFRGSAPAITDANCPHATRADYTCDGSVDIQDVVRTIDLIFRGGPPLCNPCSQ